MNRTSVKHPTVTAYSYRRTFCISSIMLIVVLATLVTAFAQTTWYVDASIPASGSGLSWATAKKTIQEAVDLSQDDDTVLVTNGIYNTGGVVFPGTLLTNRVCITNEISLISVNGPAVTHILGAPGANGSNDADAVRCIYLKTNSFISGFTIADGHTLLFISDNPHIDNCGGGVCCNESSAPEHRGTISNCVIANCRSAHEGGGLQVPYMVIDCVVSNNGAAGLGGGCCLCRSIINSTFINNRAGYGGATYLSASHRSHFSGNTAQEGGAGYSSSFYNCTIVSNTASEIGGAIEGRAYNCFVIYNSAPRGGAGSGFFYNCTIVSNSASIEGGGIRRSRAYNCIIWDNYSSDPASSNYVDPLYEMINCCTAPLPPIGSNNIVVADPLFIDPDAGNYQLQTSSPCVNAGNNMYAPTNETPCDLAGQPRIAYTNVDIGAYEVQNLGWQYIYNFLPSNGQHYVTTNRAGLSASAASGLPVSFSILEGPGLLSGSTNVTFTDTGRVVVVASQPGDISWPPAPEQTNVYFVHGIPTAGVVTIIRETNQLLKIADYQLLTNAVDPEGAELHVSWITPTSTNGFDLTMTNHWIYYDAPASEGRDDGFYFQIKNPYGGTDYGKALILVRSSADNNEQTRNIISVQMQGSDMLVCFAGIPDRTYDVQATTNLSSPLWTTVGSCSIGTNGYVVFIDSNAPPARYYRTAIPE